MEKLYLNIKTNQGIFGDVEDFNPRELEEIKSEDYKEINGIFFIVEDYPNKDGDIFTEFYESYEEAKDAAKHQWRLWDTFRKKARNISVGVTSNYHYTNLESNTLLNSQDNFKELPKKEIKKLINLIKKAIYDYKNSRSCK